MDVKQLQRRFNVRLLGLGESHYSDIISEIERHSREARFLAGDERPEVALATDTIFEQSRMPRGVVMITGAMNDFLLDILSRSLRGYDLFDSLYELRMTEQEYRHLRRSNRDPGDLFSAFAGTTNHFLSGSGIQRLIGENRCLALTHDSFERLAVAEQQLVMRGA